jgi:hypothetical protein
MSLHRYFVEALTVQIYKVALVDKPGPRCAEKMFFDGMLLGVSEAMSQTIRISGEHEVVFIEDARIVAAHSSEFFQEEVVFLIVRQLSKFR